MTHVPYHIESSQLICIANQLNGSLREECPNTEFLLVQMQENTDQKKLRIWTLFHAVVSM